MLKKKNLSNSASTTKRQPSGTGAKPSRLLRLLLALVGFKICLLGVILLEPKIELPEWGRTELPAMAATPVPARIQPEPGVAFAAEPQAAQAPKTAPAPQSPADRLTLETLSRRQEELARKEQDLKVLEAELNARLEELQGLENRLRVMLKDAEETKDAKYKHLVDVLSNMKARQAAEVLETLDEKIAVRVLAGMRGRQAGEILSYAQSAKAARLTEALARMQIPLE